MGRIWIFEKAESQELTARQGLQKTVKHNRFLTNIFFREVDFNGLHQYNGRHNGPCRFHECPPHPPILQPSRFTYFSITADLDTFP